MSTAAPPNVQSSRDILSWQYKTLLGELQQIELHVSSGDCPCILKDLDPAEYCLAKHTLNVATLAAETANMDRANAKLLAELNDSAIEKHDGVKTFVCHKGDLPELAEWARSYRKKLEPVYYACSRKAKMGQVAVVSCPPTPREAAITALAQEPAVKISGKCQGGKSCSIKMCASPKTSITVTGKCNTPDCLLTVTAARKHSEKVHPKDLQKVISRLRGELNDATASPLPDATAGLGPLPESVAPPSTSKVDAPAETVETPAKIEELPRDTENADEIYRKMLRYAGNIVAFKVEDGALVEAPVYEGHKRGKNWFAVIESDPKAPGGLKRAFQRTGNGRYYYIVDEAALHIGDAVEFGADYYTTSGSKNATRWYGVVAAISPDRLYLGKYGTAAQAIKASRELKEAMLAQLEQQTAKMEICPACLVALADNSKGHDTMTEIDPAPWHANTVVDDGVNLQGVDIMADDGTHVAVAYGRANAKLIAAAPELHNVIEQLLLGIRDGLVEMHMTGGIFTDWLDRATAAYSKAEGHPVEPMGDSNTHLTRMCSSEAVTCPRGHVMSEKEIRQALEAGRTVVEGELGDGSHVEWSLSQGARHVYGGKPGVWDWPFVPSARTSDYLAKHLYVRQKLFGACTILQAAEGS